MTTTGSPLEQPLTPLGTEGGGSALAVDRSARARAQDASPLMTPQGEEQGAGVSGLLRTVKRRQGIFLFTFVLEIGRAHV